MKKTEYLLQKNSKRLTLYPLKYPDIFEFYKTHQAAFWTDAEIDFSKDKAEFDGLSPAQQHFLKVVLAFFAASDGIVSENLMMNFIEEVRLPEAKVYYAFQLMMENIHNKTYSIMIDLFEQDHAAKMRLFRGIEHFAGVKAKAAWALKWLDPKLPFGERLVAFAAVEGILFSASFCAIFYFKHLHKLPGLCFSNELIARDEGLHTCFAAHLFTRHLQYKPSEARVCAIVREAVVAEATYVREALPHKMIGMNASLMLQYVRFVADGLLEMLELPTIFGDANPFDWMELISMQGKTNFFEKRVGDYQKVGVKKSKLDDEQFGYDDNF